MGHVWFDFGDHYSELSTSCFWYRVDVVMSIATVDHVGIDVYLAKVSALPQFLHRTKVSGSLEK